MKLIAYISQSMFQTLKFSQLHKKHRKEARLVTTAWRHSEDTSAAGVLDK
jgi:hypothetical protein